MPEYPPPVGVRCAYRQPTFIALAPVASVARVLARGVTLAIEPMLQSTSPACKQAGYAAAWLAVNRLFASKGLAVRRPLLQHIGHASQLAGNVIMPCQQA
jgi:hypothetical protein